MYLLLLALIYLAFISLGLPDSLLGAAWPAMQPSLSVPLSYMGIISMIVCAGTVVASLLSERLTTRFGTKYVTTASVLLSGVSLLGYAMSGAFWQLCLWSVPFGLAAGAIDAALNNYVALHYNSRHMSWLHCFWGLGAIISPYIMSGALTFGVWNDGYRICAYIQIGIAAVLAATLWIWRVNKTPKEIEETTEVLGLKGALRLRGVPSVLIAFFAYCAAECTAFHWASSYLAEYRHIGTELAAAFGALFFIGITAGRFFGGFISEKVGDRRMIRIGTAILAAGLVLLLLPTKSDVPALVGLVLLGFGCAPIYPCIIHDTPVRFGAKNAQAIIGIQMASAYIGSTFIPPLFGLVAKYVGIGVFPVYMLVFFGLMFAMTEKTMHGAKTE